MSVKRSDTFDAETRTTRAVFGTCFRAIVGESLMLTGVGSGDPRVFHMHGQNAILIEVSRRGMTHPQAIVSIFLSSNAVDASRN